MANTIKLKRGTSTPSTSDISNGEVAIDTSAKKLYINDSGTVKEIGGSGTIGGASGLDFNDDVKVRFGTGNDLSIYHDGSDNYIDGNSAAEDHLYIRANVGADYSSNIYLQAKSGENSIVCRDDESAELYYDNTKRFETTAGGTIVTGTLGTTGTITGGGHIKTGSDSGYFLAGASNDLQILHNGTSSFIDNNNGSLYIRNNVDDWGADHIFIEAKSGDSSIKCLGEADVELYYDGSKKLETASDKILFHAHAKVNADNTYDLGASGARWKDLYIYNDIDIKDNGKILLGDGDDLQLYHSGTNSVIDNNTGGLYIRNNVAADVGGDIFIQAKSGEDSAKFTHDGSVELRYDNVKKFETTTSGATCTGWLQGTQVYATDYIKVSDGDKFLAGNADDLQIYHDGSHSYIANTTGNLYITENGYIELSSANGGEKYATFLKDGAVDLYYDDSKKFETTAGGVKVTGGMVTDAVALGDNEKITFGDSDDLQIYHDGSNSRIHNSTGELIFRTGTNYTFYNSDASEKHAQFKENGAVELYYDNAKTFSTSANAGIVWGTEGNNATLYFHADEGDDWADYWNITATTAGQLDIQCRNDSAGFEDTITATRNGSVELYYDNSKKLNTHTDGVEILGKLYMADSKNIELGSGQDLKLYHDGSNSKIENATGELRLQNSTWIKYQSDSGHIFYNASASETLARFNNNGAVELYYDNSKKLETTSSGVTVTGYLGVDELGLGDNERAKFGNGEDLQIWHDGSNSYIHNATNSLIVRTGGLSINDAANAKNSATFDTDGSVELYHNNVKTCYTHSEGIQVQGPEGGNAIIYLYADEGDDNADKYRLSSLTNGNWEVGNYSSGSAWETNIRATGGGLVSLYYDDSKKLETTSTGIWCSGYLSGEGLDIADNKKLLLGSGDDLEIYHDGNNSFVQDSGTGELKLAGNVVRIVNADNSETQLKASQNGAVELYYDNTKKLETTAHGIKVYGAEGNNGVIQLAADEGDDNADLWRHLATVGSQYFLSNYASGGWEHNIGCTANGSVELYYDNSKKFHTNSGGVEISGHCYFPDNNGSYYGAGEDLKIYHDGTNNWIKSATGQLKLETVDSIQFFGNNSETLAQFSKDGAVQLYYDNSKKFETTSTGAKISSATATLLLQSTTNGNTPAITLTSDSTAAQKGSISYTHLNSAWVSGYNEAFRITGTETNLAFDVQGAIHIPDSGTKDAKLLIGGGHDIEIYHDGTDSKIFNHTGTFKINANDFLFQDKNEGDTFVKYIHDGAVELYYNGSKKFETLSNGAIVTGQFYCTSEVNMTGQGDKYIDTAHLNNNLRFRRINDGDTGHSDHCTVSSAGVWSADFNDVSDEKLKENIVAIADGAISKIKQLRPVNFDWKATDKAKNVSGFIAQELKTVLPNLVYGTEYDPTIIDQSQGIKSTGYSVNTIGIVANLTKALQEAITKIETLETKVAALESA